MSLQLPSPPGDYSREDQANLRLLLQNFGREVLRRGDDLETGRIIRTSPNGTRWEFGVDDLGATVWTALP